VLEFPPFNLRDCACNPNSISKEDIERIAIDVRTQWGLRDLPIGNLLRRAEDNGILVLIDDTGFEAMDSCALGIVNRCSRTLDWQYTLLLVPPQDTNWRGQ